VIFSKITDARDGLYPALRQTLSILQTELPENRFWRSSKILQIVADTIESDVETIYDALVDTTWPRSELPLIQGHGNFGFPPAHPNFSEIKMSDFCKGIISGETILDFSQPLAVPIPYAIVNGTIGYSQSVSKIPSHNLGEVIDAAIAFIKDPTLKTEQLLQIIKGPDLLVGGTIENPEELCSIYESGQGIIKVIVTPDTINNRFFDTAKDYGIWYGTKVRKVRMKDACRLEVPYHAFLSDGAQTRFMSLDEMLQVFIDHYRSAKAIGSDDELCLSLSKYKDLSSARMTLPHF